MSKKNNIEQDLAVIKDMLLDMKAKHKGEFEFVFQAALYKDGRPDATLEAMHLVEKENLLFYIKTLVARREYFQEIMRFKDVSTIPKFKVICRNASKPPEGADDVNWMQKDKEYLVVGAIDDKEAYCLWLRIVDADTGYEMCPPFPMEGYDSRRFQIVDYTNLN